MSGTLAQRAVRGALWSGLSAYGSFALNLGAGVVAARLIEPTVFGAFAFASAACELAFIPAGISLSQATIQLHGLRDDLEDTVVVLSALLAGFLFLAVLAAEPWISRSWGPGVARAFIVVAAARGLAYVTAAQLASLESRFEYGRTAALRIGSAALTACSVVLLALTGRGIEAVVAREALPNVFVAVSLLAARSSLRPPGGRRWSRETASLVLRKVGMGWGLVRGLEILLLRGDQLLVGLLFGERALGLYYQAKYLTMLPFAALAPAMQQVALRTYSALRDRPAAQLEVYGLSRFFVLRALLPVAVVVATCPEAILWCLFGAKWLAAGPALALFAPWLILFPLFETGKTLLLARLRYAEVATLYGVAMATASLAMLAASRQMGGASAAAGLGLGYLAATVLGDRQRRAQLQSSGAEGEVSSLGAALAVGLGAAAARGWFGVPAVGTAAVSFAAATLAAAACAVFFAQPGAIWARCHLVISRGLGRAS